MSVADLRSPFFSQAGSGNRSIGMNSQSPTQDNGTNVSHKLRLSSHTAEFSGVLHGDGADVSGVIVVRDAIEGIFA